MKCTFTQAEVNTRQQKKTHPQSRRKITISHFGDTFPVGGTKDGDRTILQTHLQWVSGNEDRDVLSMISILQLCRRPEYQWGFTFQHLIFIFSRTRSLFLLITFTDLARTDHQIIRSVGLCSAFGFFNHTLYTIRTLSLLRIQLSWVFLTKWLYSQRTDNTIKSQTNQHKNSLEWHLLSEDERIKLGVLFLFFNPQLIVSKNCKSSVVNQHVRSKLQADHDYRTKSHEEPKKQAQSERRARKLTEPWAVCPSLRSAVMPRLWQVGKFVGFEKCLELDGVYQI